MSAVSQGKILTFYHYTDKDSLESIKKMKVIKHSRHGRTADDVCHGPGTYGTSKTPESGKWALALNNYNNGELAQKKLREGKLDWGIRLLFPEENLDPPKTPTQDILIYRGDVKLSDHPEVTFHKVYKD